MTDRYTEEAQVLLSVDTLNTARAALARKEEQGG